MAEDFANAAKEVVVVSPFMRNGRVAQVVQWLLPARLNNIEIAVITRATEAFKEKDRPAVIACVEILKSAGIQVVQKLELHQRFIIIDRKTVWYGSINLLSYGSAEENIIRLESCELASELLRTLQV